MLYLPNQITVQSVKCHKDQGSKTMTFDLDEKVKTNYLAIANSSCKLQQVKEAFDVKMIMNKNLYFL